MRLKARLLFWPLLVIGTFLAIELLTRAALRISYGRPVVASEFLMGAFAQKLDAKGCTWGDSISPHPYLGYAYHRGSDCSAVEVNAFGFKGPEIPTPEERKEGFFILMLGGSVAEITLRQKINYSELALHLNKYYVSPNGKPFRFINGAIAGGRHPVQSVAFQYFADNVDAVISIEGFNDIVKIDKKDFFLNPPYIWYEFNTTQNRVLLYSLGLSSMTALQRWLATSEYRNRILSLAFLSAKARSAFAYRVVKEQSFFPRDNLSTLEQINKNLVSSYRRQIRLLAAMAKSMNLPFAIFFQPVPALYKKLSPEEKSVVGDLSYGDFYQEAVESLLTLNAEKINAFSLLEIFQDIPHGLYTDHIHFSRDAQAVRPTGYDVMAEQISKRLAKAWGLKARAEDPTGRFPGSAALPLGQQ